MKLRPLLILPVLCLPAWFAGRYSAGSPAVTEASANPTRTVPPHTSSEPPQTHRGDAWDLLSKQQPTPENRWQALTLFEQWAKIDPRTAAMRLAAMPEGGCRLWPKQGALEAFCKVWATRDLDAAWTAVQNDPLKSQRDTVAAFRVTAHAEEIATDASIAEYVRNMAQCKIAARDPAAAHRLGFLKDDALVSALLSGSESPFARWRAIEKLRDGNNRGNEAALDRLALISRETVLTMWNEAAAAGDENGGGEHFQGSGALQALAHTAANPDELKAVTPGTDQELIWAQVMSVWDDATLHSVLQGSAGRGNTGEGSNFFSYAVAEMLGRDPSALLPYVRKWAAETTADSVGESSVRPHSTPEYAAKVRALIEAVPPDWQRQLALLTQTELADYEPAFLLGQIELHHRNSDKSDSPEKDDGELQLSTEPVFNRWLQSDPAKAMAWLEAHPAILSSTDVQRATKEWVEGDPEAASAWINTLPAGANKDGAIRGLVEVMMVHDPASASSWAARIDDPREREGTQQAVMQQWRQWNPDAQPVKP